MKMLKYVFLLAGAVAVGAALSPQIKKSMTQCQKNMRDPWKKAKKHSKKFKRAAVKTFRDFKLV